MNFQVWARMVRERYLGEVGPLENSRAERYVGSRFYRTF